MVRRCWRLALAASCGLAAGTLATPAPASAAAPVATAALREREGPATVPPVVHRGVRYEAIHWGKERGLAQNGGYVAAIDSLTGRELWLVRLYAIDYALDKEPDRLDVFIVSMKLAPDGRRLLVADENGRRFSLDLATRQVVEQRPPQKR